MTIYTEEIVQNAKVIKKFLERGDQKRESVYLDFETSCCYFKSSTGHGFVRFRWEGDPGEVENFFVEGDALLHIAGHYEELEIGSDRVFRNGLDEFQLNTFTDDMLAEDVKLTDLYPSESFEQTVVFDNDRFKKLQTTSKFVDPQIMEKSILGVFIQEGLIFATSGLMIYDAPFDEDVNMRLPLPAVQAVLTFGKNSTLYYSDSTEKLKITSADQVVEVLLPNNASLTAPKIHGPEFKAKYDHSTTIIVDREALIDAVGLLSRYTMNDRNDRFYILFGEDKTMAMETRDQKRIRKSFECEFIHPSLVGNEIIVSASRMILALSSLENEHITLAINMDMPPINLYNAEDPATHAILARMKE